MTRFRSRFWVAVALGGLVGAVVGSRAIARLRADTPPFTKQTFRDKDQLVAMFASLWRHPEALALMRSNPAIGRPLTEKIMRAISQAYGTYVPTVTQRVYAWRWPRESVTQSQEQVSPAENEAVALAFARHYAETRGNPSSAQVEKLTATYGVRNVRDLVTFIRLVTIGVLVGNTVDAVVSRFLGRPSPQTSFADEVGVLAFFFLGMVPLVPVMYLRTLINPAG